MVKLIMGIMYSDQRLLEKIQDELVNKFGKVEAEIAYDFNFTKYYEKEMGKNLKKKLLAFKSPIKKEQLAGIKVYTTKLENKHKKNDKRKINIDPGCLSKKEFILASFKKSPYKKSLGKNVYAHLTLKFEDDKCVTNYRTFPDFKTKKTQGFLSKIRKG